MNIAVASDHAGFDLKKSVKEYLRSCGHRVTDYGAFSAESVDYPDYGFPAARGVAGGRHDRGILICGTGQGMSMTANRVKGVRAALCLDTETARMARRHNDANVLVLSSWRVTPDRAREILDVWLATAFEGGRHLRRIEKLDLPEPQEGDGNQEEP